MKTKSLILILFMAISTMLVAQEPAITLRAPSMVGVGQQFSVTYEVNARPSDFKTPTFTDFNFLGGPYGKKNRSFHTNWYWRNYCRYRTLQYPFPPAIPCAT